MSTNELSRSSASRPKSGRGRLAGAILATATALGLLFGLTAPSVSPVTPTLPGVLPVSAVVAQDPAVVQVAPFDARGRGDGGRR
jgi:hypothetical protein